MRIAHLHNNNDLSVMKNDFIGLYLAWCSIIVGILKSALAFYAYLHRLIRALEALQIDNKPNIMSFVF